MHMYVAFFLVLFFPLSLLLSFSRMLPLGAELNEYELEETADIVWYQYPQIVC